MSNKKIVLPFSELEAEFDDQELLLGTLDITENGEYDVTRYQVANVEVKGGYDLVLSVPYTNLNANAVEVIEGDILECEQKIANDETVNAILIITDEYSVLPSGANAPNVNFIAKLTKWNCPNMTMSFSAIYGYTTDTNGVRLDVFNIAYDPDDGSILAINNPYSYPIPIK